MLTEFKISPFAHLANAVREAYAAEAPLTNLLETSSGFALEISAPGVKPEGLSVDFDNSTLSVCLSRELASAEGKSLRRERLSFQAKRSYALPDSIDANRITASLENGLLRVWLPLREEAKPKKIDVKVN